MLKAHKIGIVLFLQKKKEYNLFFFIFIKIVWSRTMLSIHNLHFYVLNTVMDGVQSIGTLQTSIMINTEFNTCSRRSILYR